MPPKILDVQQTPARPAGSPEPAPRRVNQRVVQTDRKALLSARFYKISLIVGMGLLFCLVSFTQGRLNIARDRLGLTRVTPLENAPPVLAFTTVALGSFRGLIANMLWIRMSDLQEQDKYFEMVQLSDWITKMQPHIVTVWVHQAWNMAYNISIKFNDPRDRWQWVRRGIELLRDEGLKYNPNEVLIYRELAWFFQHKMGADLDDAHGYYKHVWAKEMNQVLGRERSNLEHLLNPDTPEAKAQLKTLTERFKMNPQWMKEADEKYGPLEWHLPESHAIYWAYLALEKTDKRKLKKEDLITCRRVIFQSLQLAFRRGRLVYPVKSSDDFIYAPNLEVVAQANKAYEAMMEAEPEMRQNIATAHRNFIRWAIYYLYLYNRKSEAAKWWNILREKYPAAIPPGQDLEQYAFERAQETVGETSHDDAKAVIEGFIQDAFLYLAVGEDAKAQNYLLFAEKFRDRFQSAIGEKSEKRVGLPPLSEIKREVLSRLLDPKGGLEPSLAAQLRTNLGISADVKPSEVSPAPPSGGTTSTNAPSQNNP